MERYKYNYCSTILLICVIQVSKVITVSSLQVGDQCSGGLDCNSDVLFCSDCSTCQCNQTIALLSYRLKADNITVEKQILCELLKQCDIENECRSEGFTCVENDNFSRKCQCAEGFLRIKLSKDKEVCMKLLNLGDSCGNISQHYSVCNPSKNLLCTSGICDCEDGNIFDFKQDKCVDRSEYLNSHGSSSLGFYGHYCRTTENCYEDMECLDMQCACPLNCTEELIKVPHLCFCPSNYSFNVASGFPFYTVFFIIVGFLFYLFCAYIAKRYQEDMNEERELVENSTTTRVRPPICISFPATTTSTITDSPVRIIPTAPTIPQTVDDAPPTYDEAMLQRNTGATIETHLMGPT